LKFRSPGLSSTKKLPVCAAPLDGSKVMTANARSNVEILCAEFRAKILDMSSLLHVFNANF
jgi:hypothetical protein